MPLLRRMLCALGLLIFASAALAAPKRMTWDIDGVQRHALVFAPQAGGPQDKHPLIFAFHGHGGNPKGFSKMAALQERWPDAIVVYPQGLSTYAARDPQGHKSGWQHAVGEDGDRDLKLFDAMLASMRREFNVDDQRVYAHGFSNGAVFSLLLWTQRSDKIAAFAVVAGSLDPSQKLPQPKPVLHVAGEKDPIFPPAKVAITVADERRVDGAEGAGTPCGEGCMLYQGTRAPVRFITHPKGHVYPPSAADWTVQFFKAHPSAPLDADRDPRRR